MPAANESVLQPLIIAIMGLLSARDQAQPDTPQLTISGEPVCEATPASFYTFTPTVFQNTDGALQFTIENKPSWASFGRKRGTLYGVPQATHAGTYPDIVITVSDGTRTVQLPPFSIQVSSPVAAVVPGPG